MKSLARTFCLSLAIVALPSTSGRTLAAGASCESLASLPLPQARITAAQTVAAGSFQPPAPTATRSGAARGGAAAAAQRYARLPSFCRVSATLTPSSDSDIKIEVWLPTAGWNGKLQAVGNGGWAGNLSYGALAQAVAEGYASVSTDTGHTGGTGAFAFGHPEKVIDFGYRAVHEMTVKAKAVVDAFYGSAPTTSFWNGCSTGGRQGITEAQRYPADYDAIVAGAPAVNGMLLHAVRVAMNRAVHRSADSYIPPEKYPMLHEAALRACDAADGVTDGVIDNPTRCRFDPQVLACKGADDRTCLTNAQVETARALLKPVVTPAGKQLFPALLLPGSELGWGIIAGPQPLSLAVDAFKYIVYNDANWDASRFDPRDIERALAADNGVINSSSTNLKPFFDRGGKLLMYHGWADPQVPALNSVEYFDAVVNGAGKQRVGKSIQLYMIPGMGHCAGGPGTDTFGKMAAIEDWVRRGTAPARIVASHVTSGTVDRSRPLCPYGQFARYKGTGSTDDAASFECAAQ